MITNQKPLALAEVKDYLKDPEESKEMLSYLKKFTKLTKEKALALMEEIRGLNNLKVKEDDIVKVADLVPKDAEDVNKIFSDVSLSEEEVNAILEITKKY